jgi:hypothetical protein
MTDEESWIMADAYTLWQMVNGELIRQSMQALIQST